MTDSDDELLLSLLATHEKEKKVAQNGTSKSPGKAVSKAANGTGGHGTGSEGDRDGEIDIGIQIRAVSRIPSAKATHKVAAGTVSSGFVAATPSRSVPGSVSSGFISSTSNVRVGGTSSTPVTTAKSKSSSFQAKIVCPFTNPGAAPAVSSTAPPPPPAPPVVCVNPMLQHAANAKAVGVSSKAAPFIDPLDTRPRDQFGNLIAHSHGQHMRFPLGPQTGAQFRDPLDSSNSVGPLAPPPPPSVPPPPPDSGIAGAPPPPPGAPRKQCANGHLCPHNATGSWPEGFFTRFSKYCHDCRFICGDAFRPAEKVLATGTVTKQQRNAVLEVPVYPGVPPVGSPPGIQLNPHGVVVGDFEVRCISSEPTLYKEELTHKWPDSGVIVMFSAPPNFGEQRQLKIDAVHGENIIEKEDQVPFNIRALVQDAARRYPPMQSFRIKVRTMFNLRGGDPNLRIGLIQLAPEVSVKDMASRIRACNTTTFHSDRQRVIKWVEDHLPPQEVDEEAVTVVDPPEMSLLCPMSLERMKTAARSRGCTHLQCFDLDNFISTVKLAPPKRKWVCPVCDLVCLPHQLVLDQFVQHVLDTESPDAEEVLISTSGAWTVSKEEDCLSDMSDDMAGLGLGIRSKPKKKTTADIYLSAALSTKKRPEPSGGSGISVISMIGSRKEEEDRKRQRKQEEERREAERKKREWEKLQYSRYGWMEDGEMCSMCKKRVQFHGGLVCGRNVRNKTEQRGCGKAICWKCFRNLRDPIKTTKAEYEDLGEDAWWMHEKCMSKEDKNAYYGEEIEDEKPKKSNEDREFAWE